MCSESDIALRVCAVGKCYEMYDKPYHRLWQTLTRGKKQFYREFWALRDVSFEVQRGQCVGIIGRNGSGKSVLLQIIAGTLSATTGSVMTHGRIAALLELGSGFSPEFTGRENVFMNGTVLGLSRKELEERYDAIEAFADIGDFIDQPVKTYSSGMLLRLAFAVQTQVDPEILIVDEALAVGDIAFVSKCMKQLDELLARGTTVLMATHDTQMVRSKCHRAIMLSAGRLVRDGDTRKVTGAYIRSMFVHDDSPPDESADVPPESDATSAEEDESDGEVVKLDGPELVRWGAGELRIRAVRINQHLDLERNMVIQYGQALCISLQVEARQPLDDPLGVGLGLAFRNSNGLDIITVTTLEQGFEFPPMKRGERFWVSFRLKNILQPGEYLLVVNAERRIGDLKLQYLDFVENALRLTAFSDKKLFSLVLPEVEVYRSTGHEAR